jgi:hypothetical protein
MSLAVAADLLYTLPLSNDAAWITVESLDLKVLATQYGVWAILNFGILLLSTLVLMDDDLQR